MSIKIDVHVHIASMDELKTIKAMLANLLELGETTMTVISDFAASQSAFNDRMDVAITGLREDIVGLNAKIDELQNSPGEITPEDQALLNEVQQRSAAILSRLEEVDAMTPPAPPAG